MDRMDRLARALAEVAQDARQARREPMAAHTSFRIGGPADLIFFPRRAEQVAAAIRLAREFEVPCQIIGNGSNLLVRDGGIRGLVIELSQDLAGVRTEGRVIRAQAGLPLALLSREARNHALDGLAFAAGIPGTVGGAVAMNAGAYDGMISQVLTRALVLADGRMQWLPLEALALGYRASNVLSEGWVVLEAEFALAPGDGEAIQARMNELARRRREKQPLNLPSAGSVFKRPEGHFAGDLIERAGLKGARVGGAMVSELHAGFIVNAGGACARDVLALIERIQAEVSARFGVRLHTEIRVIGEA